MESIANGENQSLTFATHLCKTPGVWAVSVRDWDQRSTHGYRVRRCGSRPIEPNRWPVPSFVRWFWCALKSACCRSFASTGTKQGRTAPKIIAKWMQFTSTRTAHGVNFRNDGRAMCRGEAPRGCPIREKDPLGVHIRGHRGDGICIPSLGQLPAYA